MSSIKVTFSTIYGSEQVQILSNFQVIGGKQYPNKNLLLRDLKTTADNFFQLNFNPKQNKIWKIRVETINFGPVTFGCFVTPNGTPSLGVYQEPIRTIINNWTNSKTGDNSMPNGKAFQCLEDIIKHDLI